MRKSPLLPLILIVALLLGIAAAQSPAPVPAAREAPAASEPQKPEAPPVPEVQPKEKKPERRISAKEADELFRSVDQILKFVSEDTGLPIKHPVKRELATRAQVEQYVQQRMHEDKDSQRLQRSEVVLKKLGLLPRDFDLPKFFVELMREQVAGYYDTKTKTVYLLDWIEPASQRPVLAHELTHALQDQNFDLDHWLEEPDKRAASGDSDDEATARVAVTEGQAMIVLLDYMLQPTGRTLARSPEMALQFRSANTMADVSKFPLLKSAPLLLRESLSFPYSFGLWFEYDLLVSGGKKLGFTEIFKRPPHTTRQIMNSNAYLRNETAPRFRLPDLKRILGENYREYDSGGVGQFDVYVITKQFNGENEAQKISPKWRGGAYLAARKTGDEAAKPKPPAGSDATQDAPPDASELALLYVSRWATAQDAARFARDYAEAVPKKYKSAVPAGGDPARQSWTTEEGTVSIETAADHVLILESFDTGTAARLRSALLPAAPAAAAAP